MEALYWLIAGIILSVIEIVTPGFVVIWFGLSAIVVSICAYLGIENLTAQVIIFSISSLTLTALSRTIFKKYFFKVSPGSKIKSSLEKLIGSTGIVIEEINNNESKGRVLVNSENWSARSINNKIITVGTKICVVKIDGIKLIIEPIE